MLSIPNIGINAFLKSVMKLLMWPELKITVYTEHRKIEHFYLVSDVLLNDPATMGIMKVLKIYHIMYGQSKRQKIKAQYLHKP